MKLFNKILLIILLTTGVCYGAAPNRPANYVSNTTISSSDANSNENTVYSYLQAGVDTYSAGSIVNAGVSASAAIANSKLNLTTITQNVAFSDTYLLDLSAINDSVSTEGLKLPQTTSCASATAQGQVCWNTSTKILSIGDGTTIVPSTPQFNVNTFTRDTATASGTQAITGVGFKPKYVMFWSVKNASTAASLNGYDDGTTAACLQDSGTADTYTFQSAESLSTTELGTSNVYKGHITSLDTDGFTITWTKVNTPTGNVTNYFTAFR